MLLINIENFSPDEELALVLWALGFLSVSLFFMLQMNAMNNNLFSFPYLSQETRHRQLTGESVQAD